MRNQWAYLGFFTYLKLWILRREIHFMLHLVQKEKLWVYVTDSKVQNYEKDSFVHALSKTNEVLKIGQDFHV